MSYHPCGDTVKILGVNSPTNGQSCEEHHICGEDVIEDVVLHLRKAQVQMNQQEQSAIAAFWVSDGIDLCCIGYLPKAYVKNWKQYDGALVQVVEVYSGDSDSPMKCQKSHRNHGLAVAVIISSPEPCRPVAKKQKTNTLTLKSPNGKGVANKTVGTKEVNETPDTYVLLFLLKFIRKPRVLSMFPCITNVHL